MKIPSILIATLLAATCVSRALTDAEITSSALLGKTLTFQAASGTGLLPTSGSWTGKFVNNAGRDFIITNLGGTVSNHTSAYTAITAGKPTIFTIGSVYEDSGQATLTLSLSGSQGLYTMSCVFVDASVVPPTIVTATQGGSFTIDSAPLGTPEIEVKEGSRNLVDGKAKSDFGTVKVGKKSKAVTYRITNKGKAVLKNLKIAATGPNKGDFAMTKPGASTLAAGKSTTFTITFKPTGKGTRNATIKIASNDANENPFDIQCSGLGTK